MTSPKLGIYDDYGIEATAAATATATAAGPATAATRAATSPAAREGSSGHVGAAEEARIYLDFSASA